MPSEGRLRQALLVYLEPRLLGILVLGISSGLPLALSGATLSIWLAETGVSKTAIGAFALVGTAYTLKFIWAPLVDRMPIPVLTARLGRRRAWLVLTHLLCMAAIVGLGLTDPAIDARATAVLAVAVAFTSATQDIVIDAFRVEILDERRQGAGAAMVVFGFRVGMLISGAGALFLAEHLSWAEVYGLMAAALLVGIAVSLAMREPAVEPAPLAGADAGGLERARVWIAEAVVEPFVEFLGRPGAFWILAFIVFYKFGDAVAAVMANPFYVELGFAKAEIAEVAKLYGFAATMIGIFLGGVMVARVGIVWSLVIGGVLQLASNLVFVAQAMAGHDLGMLAITVAVENLSGGLGTAAFVAFLSSLCNVAYTATQYALLSSLMATARTFLAAPGGWIADNVDWTAFFLISTAAAVPGLLLLAVVAKRYRPPARTSPGSAMP